MTTESPDEIIWKLLISPNGILTGEERDPNRKRGTLFAIDVRSGNTLWRHVTIGEHWWFDSQHVTTNTLFVQGFRSPDHPEPLGIIAIDVMTGTERWRHPKRTLLAATENDLLAEGNTPAGLEYLRLDMESGQILDSYGRTKPDLPEPSLSNETHFAVHAGRDELAALDIDLSQVRGPIDSLTFNSYATFGLHTARKESTMLSNEIVIVDRKTSHICYRETIHHETPLPLPENFFVSHGFLLYVKEKRTLVAVDLRR